MNRDRLTWKHSNSRRSTVTVCTMATLVALTLGSRASAQAVPAAVANDAVSVAQQNASVQRHCVVCHNDSAKSDGLSLQGFDVAQVAPSLAAIILSEFSAGTLLEQLKWRPESYLMSLSVGKPHHEMPDNQGLSTPDRPAIDALGRSLIEKATASQEWHVEQMTDRSKRSSLVMVSSMRELPHEVKDAEVFRLVLSCNPETRRGEMRLSWAPKVKEGTFTVSVDGKTPITHTISATRRMEAGEPGHRGGGSVAFDASGNGSARRPRMPFPVRRLTIGDLFYPDKLEFPFDAIPSSARQALSACFPESGIVQ